MTYFPWASFCLGLGAIYLSSDTSKTQEESYDYPVADGMITKLHPAVDTAPGQYDYELSYVFYIDGEEYDGNKFDFSSGMLTKKEFYDVPNKYHVGKKVKVRHHPSKYYINALEAGPMNTEPAAYFFGGIFLILLGIGSGVVEISTGEGFLDWFRALGKEID